MRQPYEGHEDLYRSLSPYHRVREDAPPFLVVQGYNDTLVDVHVARDFVARFREVALAPIYYVELPFAQHSFDVTASPRTSATTRAAVAFATSVTAPRPRAHPRARRRVSGAADRAARRGRRAVVGGDARSPRERGPFFVVTSDNPFSVVRDDAANDERRLETGRAARAPRGAPRAPRWPATPRGAGPTSRASRSSRCHPPSARTWPGPSTSSPSTRSRPRASSCALRSSAARL